MPDLLDADLSLRACRIDTVVLKEGIADGQKANR